MASASCPRRCLETASGFLGTGSRIDRAAGIIRGMKLAGYQSRNTGRTIGIDDELTFGQAINQPYSYAPEAFREALPLYEGASVFLDHPTFKTEANGQRVPIATEGRTRDLIGCARNVRVEADGVYGDVHYIKSHPYAEMLAEVAEKMPDKFCASHEAYFDNPVLKNGRIVLTKLVGLDGIAITSDKGGTTHGLFETLHRSKGMKTARQLFEAMSDLTTCRKKVMEMMDDPAMAPLGDTPVMEEDKAGAASPEDQVNESFKAMITAVLSDGTLAVEEKITKISGLMKAFKAATTAVTGGSAPPPDGGEVAPVDDPEPDADDEKVAAESLAKAQGVVIESAALLSAAGIACAGPILEAMAKLPTSEARRAFVDVLPKPALIDNAPAPRSAPRPAPAKPAAESKAPNYDEPGVFARAIRG